MFCAAEKSGLFRTNRSLVFLLIVDDNTTMQNKSKTET